MENEFHAWVHDKTEDANGGMDYWHIRITKHKALFVSMSQLSGICTAKYSQTYSHGNWYATIMEETFHYTPLMISGYTQQNIDHILGIAMQLCTGWARHMMEHYTQIHDSIRTVYENTKTGDSDWYTPYGRNYDPDMYRKKILPDGTVLIITRKTKGSEWKLEVSTVSGQMSVKCLQPDGNPMVPEAAQEKADEEVACIMEELSRQK